MKAESTGTGDAAGIEADTDSHITCKRSWQSYSYCCGRRCDRYCCRRLKLCKVNMRGAINVQTGNGDAVGIGAEDSSGTTVKMDAANKTNNNITVHSLSGGNAYGMVASGDSEIVFKNVKDLTVTANAGDAYGLFANDPSTISGDVESITVTASGNAYGAYAYSGSSIDALMSGDITVTSIGAGTAVA